MQSMNLPQKISYTNSCMKRAAILSDGATIPPQAKLPRSSELRLGRLGRVDRDRPAGGALRPTRAPAARDRGGADQATPLRRGNPEARSEAQEPRQCAAQAERQAEEQA